MALRMRRGLAAPGVLLALAVAAAAATGPDEASAHNELALAHHLRRCLDEASAEYDRVLALDPPREPTAREWRTLERLVPRVFTTRAEPFRLKDFAVVMHPSARLIAFHLLWEDDVDFPEDNDPCDHEVAWVRATDASEAPSVDAAWTYFHGRLLAAGPTALEDARRHGMRIRLDVQWGKHGSLPVGWEDLAIEARPDELEGPFLPVGRPITVREYMAGTFQKLSTAGVRLAEHPLARRAGWPRRFSGSWTDFVDFSREVDARALLRARRMALVSRWNNAVLNRRFLAYNFRPKTEWP